MGATRTVAWTELPFRGISVNPASTGSAAITVVPSDSGVMFVNKYASTTTYTLPTVADAKGKLFVFFNAANADMVVEGGTEDAMVVENDAEADSNSFATSSHKIGGCFAIMCDGTSYYCMNWSYQAETEAS